mmetsp:Transcript_3925/g.9542  ORF Transcript_3925/g.9542 Transcript_3925/m.9542 type:complete len:447 (-) Transcript_3925:1875-3215(-)
MRFARLTGEQLQVLFRVFSVIFRPNACDAFRGLTPRGYVIHVQEALLSVLLQLGLVDGSDQSVARIALHFPFEGMQYPAQVFPRGPGGIARTTTGGRRVVAGALLLPRLHHEPLGVRDLIGIPANFFDLVRVPVHGLGRVGSPDQQLSHDVPADRVMCCEVGGCQLVPNSITEHAKTSIQFDPGEAADRDDGGALVKSRRELWHDDPVDGTRRDFLPELDVNAQLRAESPHQLGRTPDVPSPLLVQARSLHRPPQVQAQEYVDEEDDIAPELVIRKGWSFLDAGLEFFVGRVAYGERLPEEKLVVRHGAKQEDHELESRVVVVVRGEVQFLVGDRFQDAAPYSLREAWNRRRLPVHVQQPSTRPVADWRPLRVRSGQVLGPQLLHRLVHRGGGLGGRRHLVHRSAEILVRCVLHRRGIFRDGSHGKQPLHASPAELPQHLPCVAAP